MLSGTEDMASEKQHRSYYVCCVVQDIDNKEAATENLKLAFDAMNSNNVEPSWIEVCECMKITKRESRLFVLDPFSGPVFDHLLSVKCRIIGPLCIMSCLKDGEILPRRPHPVYSTAMRKITVTCSSIDKPTRDDICRKVELMGGIFSRDFTKSVTHLVVGDVGSKKYHVAASFCLPIMLTDWIEEVWNSGQFKQVHASDSSYVRFRCPIFKGLSISVSQLSTEERNSLQALIEQHGGHYTGALKSNETTHLILIEPKGEKYKYAKHWKLHCVKVEWVYKSIEAGYCMDELLYQLEGSEQEQKSSTPKKDMSYAFPPDAEISKISYVGLTHLEETAAPEISVQLDDTIRPLAKKTKSNMSLDLLETFDTSSLSRCGQYLDGCKFFLSGFKDSHLEKLRKIINAGGGMRFSKYSESISHVICQATNVQLLESIKGSSSRPHVVNFHWLLECCKNQKLVDENAFRVVETLPISPQKTETNLVPSATGNNGGGSQKTDAFLDDFEDVMMQYMPSNVDFSCTLEPAKPVHADQQKENDTIKADCQDADKTVNIDAEVSVNNFNVPDDSDDNDVEDESYLFRGINFTLAGFGPMDTELLSEMVICRAGTICNQNIAFVSDVAVVPILSNDLNVKAKEVATNCWLQMCIEEEKILPLEHNPLFRPLRVDQSSCPLRQCVISISQYTGSERDCLRHIIEVCGATYQEYFVRKANKSRCLLPNTHLIVASAEGSKYEASKNWFIPAITKYWLIEAVTSGQLPPLENYLIDGATVNNSDTNKILEKQPLEQEKQPGKETHEINKSEENINSFKTFKPNAEVKNCDTSPSLKKTYSSNAACLNRIKEIIDDDKAFGNKKLPKDFSNSSFLNSENEYQPNFDVDELLEHFDSPRSDDSLQRLRKKSVPIEEVFSHNLSDALEKFGDEVVGLKKPESSAMDLCYQESHGRPLSGVILYVARKLADVQGELNKIVSSLGGDYRWTYDRSCTHIVFQGKSNDLNREYRLAKEHGKKIVSPEWVQACKEAQNVVDESLFPHTFKSRLSLLDQLSTSKRSFTENNQSLQESVEKKNDSHSDTDEEKNFQLEKPESLDVNKQLEELIVAVNSAKADKLKTRRRNGSKSSSPVELGNNVSKASSIERSALAAVYSNEGTKENIQTVDTATSEPSQCLPITWDDPTGRLEREKLAEQLATSGKQVGTSQSQEDVYIPQNKKDSGLIDVGIKKPPCATDDYNLPNKKQVVKFMFTGLSDGDKEEFSEVIVQVGGLVSDDRNFDATATHLILGKPLKNEKLLSSVASGKWVLHRSYIDAVKIKKMFVNEEPYEWGGFSTKSFIQNSSEMVMKVATCPRRWRLTLASRRETAGAFHGWTVVIIAPRHKAVTYSKILKAGGAEVIPMSPPFINLTSATHAFIEETDVDIRQLVSLGVMCLKPEYLAYYLIEDPPPAEKDYFIPQALELLNRMPSSSSRLKRSHLTRADRTEVKKSRLG